MYFPREARTFIDKQMEYNIERSSSVSMNKKERKLDDGKVVWDSVLKLRKKTLAHCSKSPKNHLGIRNNWIKEFSNVVSEKASSYVLESMCAERTSRQEEIAQTLLNRFNNVLEQEASMTEPKTLTHKAMVVMADKMSLWLDKNVKVSKNVRLRLRQMEEEEKKKRLMEEMNRLEQQKRDREEEKKRKMAEEMANKKEPELSTHDEMQPPSKTEPETKKPPTDEELGLDKQETGDAKFQEKDGEQTKEAQQDDGQQALEQEPQHPPPAASSNDGELKIEGPSENENELDGAQKILEEPQAGKVLETVPQKDKSDEIDRGEGALDDAGEQVIENKEVPSGDEGKGNEGGNENILGIDEVSSPKDVKEDESVEIDVPPDSLIRKDLDVEGSQDVEGTENVEKSQNGEETEGTSHPSPDVPEMLLDTIGASYRTTTPSEVLEKSEYSVPPSSDSEFSDRDEMKIEPSKDTAILVDELLGSGTDVEDTDLGDKHDNLIEIQDDQGKSIDDRTNIQENQGKSIDDRTNMVLNELAEMLAVTPEVHSPIQEAIKDIVGKELEDRLGDRDAETINNVAGKVGTWMDKMVERAAEEYGERRPPSQIRPLSPRAVSLPTGGREPPLRPEVVPQASFSPAALPQVPTPTAVPPEGLAEAFTEISRSPYPLAPVSQKPKGPIFELRKVGPKNIFNVTGITNTKAKRKIREVRGHSASRRVSQESLDLEEWAEWAGLVSDVGQNWAKWIEGVAQAVVRPHRTDDRRLSYDAKEWKHMNKELQREGDVWMRKVVRKQSRQKLDKTPKPVSA